ncbi:MAG: LL-diaminopimelate aminotransferase [Dehalococcoides mccartyi]|jgi:LL-diaminopimelate aminotransferase|uniref:LL-diaminopimelate aminotransferase n=1 Tax=Dehalococcoides mccartyi TaxID=61435 RepID=A0AB33HUN2_9CHLR|nr:LL-diaminopimelate aminotransferase [Dehalococcoides mccartyi]MBF4482852.1 LL-diaminopimelate aminotransferase [Dehalococcoides mccartyi]MBJ7532148.1 LL-diaminopimelate aminotransferase [Dehalococcoides mccartyi]MDP4280064.1 LL-diaminopimelate aminotransferase [Dehalococcoides mccartyi]BAZ97204.1 LL-diaminopimelate aminotransferase [Dehalococcoides mccartyi]
MKLSKRIENLPPYLFVQISKKIAEKRAKGEEVISFAIGDPDLPTPKHILAELCKAAEDPANHRYPETEGLPVLRKAMAEWYEKRFGVKLNPDTEVLPLIGSKEGIGHAAWCFLDPGDVALVPDPAYPVYAISSQLAGAEVFYMPLNKENNFLPDFNAIPQDVLSKAKVLWINYPNNPTGAVAGLDFFKEAAEFAAKHNLAICHDGPYSEIAFDGYKPVSFLEADGAKEVGIEFHSLSKSYNMTGWRIGMAVGNAKMIDALRRFKSNLDSGIPQAIQLMAIAALNGSQDVISQNCAVYQRRRDRLVEALRNIGMEVTAPKASLYIWAPVPEGYTSASFATELLDKTGVVVTPGTGYGTSGEGYIRLSLTVPDEQLGKGIAKLANFKSQA